MKLYVPLRAEEIGRLLDLAKTERRTPQAQAAYLLSRSLRELPAQLPEPSPVPQQNIEACRAS